MNLELLDDLRRRAAAAQRHIVLPEGFDVRVLKAAAEITQMGMAKITVLGQIDEMHRMAKEKGISLDGVTLADPFAHNQYEAYAEQYYEMRKAKGCSRERAYEVLKSPILFGLMMLKNSLVDGMVSGASTSTADMLRPAFRIIRTRKDVKLASSAFVLFTPKVEMGDNGVLLVADSAVNPVLNAEQMADVAWDTACTARNLFHFEEPRVAMISFSTMGSAYHPCLDKIIESVKIAHEKYPDLLVDGEMQMDAAISPKVAARKAPNSPVAGRANILVFPDLNCANTTYKTIQRFSDAKGIGPLLQGMAKPVNDLSRGCTVEEIINTVAVVCCEKSEDEL